MLQYIFFQTETFDGACYILKMVSEYVYVWRELKQLFHNLL